MKQSIVITGASSGLGKACALHLDKLGFKVFAGVRKESDGKALAGEASGLFTPILLDVTQPEQIAQAVKLVAAESEYPLYGLVNNAGVGISGVLEAVPVEDFRKLMEVNVLGLHAVTQAFLPLLRKASGRIINVGSAASYFAGPGGSSYAASKFAVRALCDSLRVELMPFGISVSLVAPGAIESEIWDKSKEYKKKLRAATPPEVMEAYKPFVILGEKMLELVKPIPAINVARAVEHGLTAKNPKAVYLVGKDAKQAYKLTKWPPKWMAKMIWSHMQKHLKE